MVKKLVYKLVQSFTLIFPSLTELHIQKHGKKIENIPKVYKELEAKVEVKDDGFWVFSTKWVNKRKFNKFKKIRNDPLHVGAKGENKVIVQLSALNDAYHVFCGLRIWLPYTVRYNGFMNLRSAQIDFVVVSKKGVFVIEVKNWSNDFVKNHNGFSPYEQTDRAGRVLWITLKYVTVNIRVTNVLLTVHDNMQYDQNYKTVFVSSLERINRFLENRQDILSENDVEKIVDSLKHYVTY
ncbi:MAG: nuclease-related domain-containing protein [Candidatus Nitrosotenuis sp.]